MDLLGELQSKDPSHDWGGGGSLCGGCVCVHATLSLPQKSFSCEKNLIILNKMMREDEWKPGQTL